MEPCIRVEQMSKQYGEHLAVDSISFTVSPGEMLRCSHKIWTTSTVEVQSRDDQDPEFPPEMNLPGLSAPWQ